MWPLKWFERIRSHKLIVRLGANELQLWSSKSGLLFLEKTHSCSEVRFGQWDLLTDSLTELLAEVSPNVLVEVIVDTKWMPMSLLCLGLRPLTRRTIEALTRHRFSDIYGERAKTWRVQVDYLAGEYYGIAFACPHELIEGINLAVGIRKESRSKLSSIQSTFIWVNNAFIRGRERAERSCIVLREQDRSIFTFLSRGTLIGLHTSGPLIDRHSIDLRREADHLAKLCALSFESCPIQLYSIEAVVAGVNSDPESSWRILQQEEHPA